MSAYVELTKEKHVEKLMDLWTNVEVMNYCKSPVEHISKETVLNWVTSISENKQWKHWCIFIDRVGFVGEVSYQIGKDQEIAMLDVKILPSAWGKNIGYQMIAYAIDHLFASTLVEQVIAIVRKENTRAITLFVRAGFQKSIDNDTVSFQLDKDTWQHRRKQRVHFQTVTKEDYYDALGIEVLESQKNYVATVAYSLAQASFEETYVPLAIYVEYNMVGFLMYTYDSEEKAYWLIRILIDKKFQGLGYGVEAMKQIIEKVKLESKSNVLKLSFIPSNLRAKKIYESYGFVTTNTYSDDEIIYQLTW